jgi:NADP-dependent 3-hydroxy acid dehydrogenase YdfG
MLWFDMACLKNANKCPSSLKGQVAVVTGASSGIGKAIALGLGRRGATLCLVGRHPETLKSVSKRMQTRDAPICSYIADLMVDQDILRLSQQIEEDFHRVDILVHSAGVISVAKVEAASIDDFDRQYRTNVHAPFLLTQAMLPMLKLYSGQIVFVNSSAGLNAGANVGQYAATKHALKAVSDSLRSEVNPYGIRVLSVFPGRTATPMQSAVFEAEGKKYCPERLLQPEDVAAIVISALCLPRTAEVTDINIRPMTKPP